MGMEFFFNFGAFHLEAVAKVRTEAKSKRISCGCYSKTHNLTQLILPHTMKRSTFVHQKLTHHKPIFFYPFFICENDNAWVNKTRSSRRNLSATIIPNKKVLPQA